MEDHTQVNGADGFEAAKSATGRHLSNLGALLGRHVSRVLEPVQRAPTDSGEGGAAGTGPSAKRRGGDSADAVRMLGVLKALPWLYLAMFGFSFWWDFPDAAVRIPVPEALEAMFEREEAGAAADGAGSAADWIADGTATIPLEGLVRILSVSGLIGFLTNWLAITMLFRPARKRPLLGHGLIPSNKERIARRISKAVSEDLINPETIKRKIHESEWIRTARIQATDAVKRVIDDPEFRSALKEWMRDYLKELLSDPAVRADLAASIIRELEAFLQDRSLERFAYRAYTFLRGAEAQKLVEEGLARVPEVVDRSLDRVDDLLDGLPERIERNSDRIEEVVTQLLFGLVNRLNVEELVLDNLIRYDESKLERLIKGATHEQLAYIQYLGALLGGIGGFVIWQPALSLTALGVAGGLLGGLDLLLDKWSARRTGSER